jgi:hypothetical protein
VAMTYVLKNMYQGLLFFALPFYFKSCTLDSVNVVFVVLLATTAVLSTLDIVFDRFLLKARTYAAIFHAFALFAATNLMVPAVIPHLGGVACLAVAAGIANLAFHTLHLPLAAFAMRPVQAAVTLSIVCAAGLGFAARTFVPPVPMHLVDALVSTPTVPGATAIRWPVMDEVVCVTELAAPAGFHEGVRHVWYTSTGQRVVVVPGFEQAKGASRTFKFTSRPGKGLGVPSSRGPWRVDVETTYGQLVGRTRFYVED